MRDLNVKPTRTTSSPQGMVGIPKMPTQKEDGLAAIMARRRQASDSNTAVVQDDPFIKSAQRSLASHEQPLRQSNSSGVANDLLAAMQKRRQHVEQGTAPPSPRQLRPTKETLQHVAMSTDLKEHLSSRTPPQQSPRSLRADSLRQKSSSSSDTRGGGTGGLSRVPLKLSEVEPEVIEASSSSGSHGGTETSSSDGDDSLQDVTQLAGLRQNNNHQEQKNPMDDSSNNESFVEHYTPADASVQEQSYADSHAHLPQVQRTDSNLTDESSVTGLVADVIKEYDMIHSAGGHDDDGNDASQSEDGDSSHDDRESCSDDTSVDSSQNCQQTEKEEKEEDANASQHGTADSDNPGNLINTSERHHSEQQDMDHSESHHSAESQYSGKTQQSTFTSGNETMELLELGEESSSDAFPENGEEFSHSSDYDEQLSHDNMSGDECYTSDDQDPYYQSADDNGDEDEDDDDFSDPRSEGGGNLSSDDGSFYSRGGGNRSDDGSFYEEETYYSTPERAESFMTEQTVASQENDSYSINSRNNNRNKNNNSILQRDTSFFSVQSIASIGTLGTLSEEGTVDLEEDGSESTHEQQDEDSIYQKQTVATTTADLGSRRSIFGEHDVIEEGDEEEEESSTATGDHSAGAPTFAAAKKEFERPPRVSEASSFYSTNGYSTRRIIGAIPEHSMENEDRDEQLYDDFNLTQMNHINNTSYGTERSLRSLSVLNTVPEEGTVTESQVTMGNYDDDKSIDESTIFGSRLGVDANANVPGQNGPLPNRLCDSTDMENGLSRGSLKDPPEERAPRRGRKPAKKMGQILSRKKPGIGSRFCSLPWLIAIVLAVSLGIGVVIGILLFGGFITKQEEETPVNEEAGRVDVTYAPAGSPVQAKPDLPEEKLNVYDLICSLLDNDCTILLDVSAPQGQAFEWLINDQLANPDLDGLDAKRQVQRFALATLYHSTDGKSWVNRLNWLSEKHECQWFSSSPKGSGCSDGETFDTLALDDNNLQGELPGEIFLLTDLTSISLTNPVDTPPYMTGTLPSGWRKLLSLTSLRISGNQFGGSLLEEIGEVTSLESMDLSYNGFNGALPLSFAFLAKIKSLNLAGNMLFGIIDESVFEGTRSLVDLNLAENRITGIPTSVALLTELRSMNLASNILSDFPYAITSLSGLASLDLQGNGLSDEIPFQIGKMEGLVSLNLSNNRFSNEIPVEIGKLSGLVQLLDLSNNALTGLIPTSMGNLVNLQRLLLNGNQLRGELPVELVSLKLIREVRYDDNNFSGFVPDDVCTIYNQEPSPSSYADCDELLMASSCFTYCCTDGSGCVCRFEKTEPLRCVKRVT